MAELDDATRALWDQEMDRIIKEAPPMSELTRRRLLKLARESSKPGQRRLAISNAA